MLLVQRDTTTVQRTKGSVCQHSQLPEELLTPLVVPSSFIDMIGGEYRLENLLIYTDEQRKKIEKEATRPEQVEGCGIPVIWSGYRSVLTRDSETGTWYKLKGVGFDPNNLQRRGKYGINGTQKQSNAEFEWKMSEQFNRALEAEGIEPVMHVRGSWSYPCTIASRRPTASIIEVKGDTRLDELIAVLIMGRGLLEHADVVTKHIYMSVCDLFVNACGKVVGGLKRIMDKSGQVWGTNEGGSNAHIGNVVVYRDNQYLRLGLVDFDISADQRHYTSSQIDELQRRERTNLCETVVGSPASMRPIVCRVGTTRIELMIYDKKTQSEFVRGHLAGYNQERRYDNGIHLMLFEQAIDILKSHQENRAGEKQRVSYSETLSV